MVELLVKASGADNVIASDVNENNYKAPCRFESLDILDYNRFEKIVTENKIDYIVN